uniref:low temperature requirement protein A n=1 Tax=Halomonas sp. TaxID=1486246 RepID=UPI00260D2FA5|nr:low temperature requirement protein A [Halomonas sp.]
MVLTGAWHTLRSALWSSCLPCGGYNFAREEHQLQYCLARAFSWGYGHLTIYMSGAAVGGGFAVLVDVTAGHAEVGAMVALYAIAIPVAVYLLGLWFVRDRLLLRGPLSLVLPAFAVLILVSVPWLGLSGMTVLIVLAVVARNHLDIPVLHPETEHQVSSK